MMDFKWENGFSIAVRVEEDGTVVLSANKEGLLSLANHLVALAQQPQCGHFHLDEHNSLDDGSAELIVERID